MPKYTLFYAAAVALGLAVAPMAAQADTQPWIGTANYGVETVGPFDTYDFASSGVLLLKPAGAPVVGATAMGYYQSYVGNHLLESLIVDSPLLNKANGYEVTVVANFSSMLTSVSSSSQTFAVTGGSFQLWFDNHIDRNFNTDTGFKDGTLLMSGTVETGVGSTVNVGKTQIGGSNLMLKVTDYNHAVYRPQTLDGGESIFTLRLGAGVDNGFLNPITQVDGQLVGATGLKYAADGNLQLTTAVPEPSTYAMLLAGLGMIGLMVKRRAA